MTRQDKINEIKKYLENNEEALNNCIEELDSYNGYLNDDRYYYMEELPQFYENDVENLLDRVYFGYDEDYSTEEQKAPFNPLRDYFKYNGYGNLVSSNYKDYSSYIDDYLIEELENHKSDIYEIDDNIDLNILFNDLDKITVLEGELKDLEEELKEETDEEAQEDIKQEIEEVKKQLEEMEA